MKRKPIRVNWDELEAAFDNPNEELVYYLDLVNGHVVLEGEGEEADDLDDDESYARAVSAEAPPPADGTRAYVEPLTTETKIDWVARFVREADDLDPALAARLRDALAAEDRALAIIEALRENPDGKERWYRYRAERLRELIDSWLNRHGVVLVEPPPWGQVSH